MQQDVFLAKPDWNPMERNLPRIHPKLVWWGGRPWLAKCTHVHTVTLALSFTCIMNNTSLWYNYLWLHWRNAYSQPSRVLRLGEDQQKRIYPYKDKIKDVMQENNSSWIYFRNLLGVKSDQYFQTLKIPVLWLALGDNSFFKWMNTFFEWIISYFFNV